MGGSGGEDWASTLFKCCFCFLVDPVARGCKGVRGLAKEMAGGQQGHAGPSGCQSHLLSCRCWDDYSSLYWWVIKAPILLAIFVSVSPESPSPEPGSHMARGPGQGLCRA